MSDDIQDRVEAHAETLAEIIRCHEEQVSQLQAQLSACRAALGEACDIAWTYVDAYLHTAPGQRDGKRLNELRSVGQPK